ncbi:MAG TPA: proline racemase family protein [Acidobacteriaceae bacterium]|jgi:4-hydroxyproline epimerase|nr:proline racemase family protein [Acidobacteriaceae bacterium]
MQINLSSQRIHVIDSHTGGEPTRLVVEGGPPVGNGPLPERMRALRETYDSFRNTVIHEPRGSDVLVGALLCEPTDSTCAAGVIFFNNVGYLGMCGHGTIGLIVTLAHMGKIQPGMHRIETPVGIVTATLHWTDKVTVENVPSYRSQKNVVVKVPDLGNVRGDVAWGGNWFFLVEEHPYDLSLQNVEKLTEATWEIRQALRANNITGVNSEEIDHIELFSPAVQGAADSKNFVLCPGRAYDRSPCGTGTSAKMACLYADGKLKPGQVWRQQGILGTVFEGSVTIVNDEIIPSITGTAYVTAETTLILDADDPFRAGIPRWV